MSDRATLARKHGLKLMTPEELTQQPASHSAAELAETMSKLGYRPMADGMKGIELRNTLARLEIAPCTKGSVDSYKKKQERKANSQFKHICMNFFTFAFLGSIVLFLGTILAELVFGKAFESTPFFIGSVITLVVSFVIGSPMSDKVTFYHWQQVPLSEYRKEIPLEIVERIASIHKALPKATFSIDALVENPDPFLVVEYGDQSLYVGVWDEPDFSAKPLV